MDAKLLLLLLLRFLLTNFKTITPIATTVHFPFHRNQTFLPFPSSPSFHARHSNACQSRLIPSQKSPSTILISLANTTTTIPMPDSPTNNNQPKNKHPTTITTTTAKHNSKTQHFQIKKKKKTKKLWSTTATASSSKLHKIFTKKGQKSVHRLGGGARGVEGSGGTKKARTENNKP
jgi:hypothetical protein